MHAPETGGVLSLWAMLRDHHVLPEAGGVLDQANWTLEAFRLIDRVAQESEPRP